MIHVNTELDREEGRDDEKPEGGVDQGDLSPRALHASGGNSPRTGYEPKPLSTKVVDGTF